MFILIGAILRFLFGNKRIIVADDAKSESVPDTTTKQVEPIVRNAPKTDDTVHQSQKRPYMTTYMRMLIDTIIDGEAGPAGYNADYRNDDKWYLLDKTFDEVRELGRSQVRDQGEISSAIGGPQFLTKTLDSLKQSLGLTGKELFTIQFQQDLLVALMIRRGLMKYMRGEIGAHQFANNLAKEWASLPVILDMKGHKRNVKRGQSYYASFAGNKALHDPDKILSLVGALRTDNWVTNGV